jgi:hypothetical protein
MTLLKYVSKFARYLGESIAEGLKEGLETKSVLVVRKLDAITEDATDVKRTCRGRTFQQEQPLENNDLEEEDFRTKHDGGVIELATTPSFDAAATADAIRLHVQLLRDGTKSAKQEAAKALRQLVQNHETRTVLAEAGDLAWWVELLRNGTEAEKDVAARAVRCVTFHDTRRISVAEAGAVPLLITLLRCGSEESKITSVVALGNLALNKSAMSAV